MGQANSGQCAETLVCSFGCDVCDAYFNTPGDLQQHCLEDKVHRKLSKGKAVNRTKYKYGSFADQPGPSTSRRTPAPIPEYARPDNIWRCLSCKKFFYSETELDVHADAEHLKTDGLSGMIRSESCFCVVCKRSYPGKLEDHHAHARVHSERPNISIKDRETERVQICCVRCGIYFSSTEAKRRHFRDVEHHNVRDEETDSGTDSGDESQLDWVEIEDPEALPPLPVSISSAYAPEFSRKRASIYYPQPIAGPSNANTSSNTNILAKVEVIDYECPLCLENDEVIAALPCGHIFGMVCIQNALTSDSRCPLCRKYAETRDVRQIYLTA